MSTLAAHIADAVIREAPALGVHWQTQARSFAPRTGGGDAPLLDAERSARVVDSLGCAVRGGGRCKDDLMRVGWDFGATVHLAGVSLHHMLREIELLEAIFLYACERAAGPLPGTAAEGIAAARRANSSLSLFTLAAAKGFTNAYLTSLQDHYRALRHDLRNPLGTIKSAVSLMEDPSVAPEMRNDPRFRAMVVRNAKSLDAVISAQLSDASTLVPAFVGSSTSLRDVALAVRRDLRDDARDAGTLIEVDDALPTVLTDSTSVELVLKSIIGAAVSGGSGTGGDGATIRIGLRELRDRSAVLQVSTNQRRPGRGLDADGALDFASELSALSGGRVWREDGDVCLEVPVAGDPST